MGRVILASALLLWLWVPVRAVDPVHFADPHLKAVVEETLWISDPTPEDMLGLTSLAAEDRGITSLAGIESALNLERLWIRWNRISDLSPLAGLTNLRFLDGHGNDVISDISPLAGLTNLETLILRYNSISDVSALSGMTNLSHLHLEWNQITNISGLSGLTHLQEANLQYNSFGDISALTELTDLAFLDIRGNPLSADACAVHIPRIVANNPGIDIRHNPCTRHQVVFSSTAGGHISTPGEGEFLYDNGEIIFVQAEADPGFVFAGFSGTYNTSENPVSVTVEQDLQIRANFRSLDDPNGGQEPPDDLLTDAHVIHVDDDASGDPRPGDASVSDPMENGMRGHPFDRIQEAIDAATDGVTVFVHSGTYSENIDLLGKDIRLTGFDPLDSANPQWPVIDGGGTGPVASFTRGEGPDCRLEGFVIAGGRDDRAAAVRCSTGSPIISNCLIAGNRANDPNGAIIHCADSNAVFLNCTVANNNAGRSSACLRSSNGHVLVANSILWDNGPREVLHLGTGTVEMNYSDITNGWPGQGNLMTDPLFADQGYWADDEHPDLEVEPDAPGAVWIMGDYHLRSQTGRWDARVGRWMKDAVFSPCIDAGDPSGFVGRERFPNGHVIDMGAFGGTIEASKSGVLGLDSE